MEAVFEPGTAVVVYLKEPREQVWGALLRHDVTGLMVRGLDLGSFEDFLKQFASPEQRTIELSTVYYPVVRIEKILLDEPAPSIPSMRERFLQRAGMELVEYLGMSHVAISQAD